MSAIELLRSRTRKPDDPPPLESINPFANMGGAARN